MQLCYYPISPCYLNVNWVITAISCFYSSSLSVSEILFHSLELTSTSPREFHLPLGTFFIQILIEKKLHIFLLLIVCIFIIVDFFFFIIIQKKPPTFNNWTFISFLGSFLHQECHSQNESSSVDKPASREVEAQ